MKTLKKISLLLCMAIVTCCCFLFTGCVASGTYKFERLTYINDKGTTVSCYVNDQYQGVRLKENSFVLLLQNDTVILRTESTAENASEPSISVISGKVVKGINNEYYFIFSDSYGSTLIANVNGSTISFDVIGVTIFLKK